MGDFCQVRVLPPFDFIDLFRNSFLQVSVYELVAVSFHCLFRGLDPLDLLLFSLFPVPRLLNRGLVLLLLINLLAFSLPPIFDCLLLLLLLVSPKMTFMALLVIWLFMLVFLLLLGKSLLVAFFLIHRY